MNTEELVATLRLMHQNCPEVTGSVLATHDGLILAATGQLDADTAAATAVHLIEEVERHLSLLQRCHCDDLIAWSDSAVWYIARVTDQYMVMVAATPDCNPGMLRLVTRSMRSDVAPML